MSYRSTRSNSLLKMINSQPYFFALKIKKTSISCYNFMRIDMRRFCAFEADVNWAQSLFQNKHLVVYYMC